MSQVNAVSAKGKWWWSAVYVLLVTLALCGQECRADEDTRFVITLKTPLEVPDNFDPISNLHQHAVMMSKSVPKSTIMYMFDNIATHFNMYMFSIQLYQNEDLAIIGKMFGKEIKSIEAVTTFVASELVTDVRNLAHGLPYRQVLNRPFRDLNELSG